MEQIVADPLPQILDGVQHVPQERVQNLVGKQIVDVPVPQILEEIVELVAGEVVCNARTGVARVDAHKLSRSWMFLYHRSRSRKRSDQCDSAGAVSVNSSLTC